MDPATMMIASTMLSATQSVSQGIAGKNAAKFQAGMEEQRANLAMARGTREASEARREGRIIESNARAAMAAGGGDTTSAGSINQLSKIGRDAEYNALSAIFNAETTAGANRAQAQAYKMQGDRALSSGIMGGLTTALSGGSQIYQDYYSPPTKAELMATRRTGPAGHMVPGAQAQYSAWKAKPWHKRGSGWR